jgi:hypothetical protein
MPFCAEDIIFWVEDIKFCAWTKDYSGLGPVASLLMEDLEIIIFGV